MPPTLDEVLANDGARGSLRIYLRRVHMMENYNFIADEAAYAQNPNVAAARALVTNYVGDDAAHQINLPAGQGAAIEAAVDAPDFHPAGNEFAAARREIRGLVNDVLPDFLRHEGSNFINLGAGGGAHAPAADAGAPIADDPLADIDGPGAAAEHAAGDGPGDGPGVEPAHPEAPAAHHADAAPPAPEPARPARENPRERERERPEEMERR